jgi:hypothetical protein
LIQTAKAIPQNQLDFNCIVPAKERTCLVARFWVEDVFLEVSCIYTFAVFAVIGYRLMSSLVPTGSQTKLAAREDARPTIIRGGPGSKGHDWLSTLKRRERRAPNQPQARYRAILI